MMKLHTNEMARIHLRHIVRSIFTWSNRPPQHTLAHPSALGGSGVQVWLWEGDDERGRRDQGDFERKEEVWVIRVGV